MKVCFLTPFPVKDIAVFFAGRDRTDLLSFPQHGGYPLLPLIMERMTRNEQTEIITLDKSINYPRTYESRGLTVTICPKRQRFATIRAFNSERKVMTDVISKSTADIFHAHWTYEYAMALIDSRRLGIITIRDNPYKMLRHLGILYTPQFLIALYVLKKGRHFTAISPYVAETASRMSGISNITVIPNPIPHEIFSGQIQTHSKAETKPDHLIISSALSDAKFKNAKTAIEAFAMFKKEQPKSEYHLYGPGLRNECQTHKWAKSKGLDQGLVFHGRTEHALLMQAFANSDTILHPSLEESFGNPLIEAMALGVPVIAGIDSGGCAWVLNYGDSGILTNVKSSTAIKDALITATTDHDKINSLRNAGKAMAADRYSPGSIANQYQKIYANIIEKHHKT